MNEVICSDCIEHMAKMEPNSVDSIVTDPPYGLEFMGKDWDRLDGAKIKDKRLVNTPSAVMGFQDGNGGNPFSRSRHRFGQGEGIGRPMQEWHYAWAVAALRIAKPGAHLLAFGGTRTFHRLTCAIEDAGWEIRDCLGWIYGSGFPKSLDVSKAIDNAANRESPPGFASWLSSERKRKGMTTKELCELGKFYKKVNHGGHVSNWESGIGSPNSKQFNLLCDLLDLPFDRREEVRREILGWRDVSPGVAFSSEGPSELPITYPATYSARQWEGWGTALKPAWEPIILARKPLDGTVAQNILKWGTGAVNVDGCRVPANGDKLGGGGEKAETSAKFTNDGWKRPWMADPDALERQAAKVRANVANAESKGRWPANLLHDGSDEVLELFPQTVSQSGKIKRAGGFARGLEGRTDRPEVIPDGMGHGDSGSAARFFYCAKASRREREMGMDGQPDGPPMRWNKAGKWTNNTTPAKNNHPTVKPVALMSYLCRLVTPPNGLILDPFCGSGSTLIAAKQEGFNYLGIDNNEEYCEIARKRLSA